MKYLGSMKNKDGILEVGGVLTTQLKKDFETPLYIYDLELMEKNIKILKEGFSSDKFRTTVVYASKAYLSKGIVQVIDNFGLHIDAVSAGELHTILSTGIDHKKIHMHGNNKSMEEIELCVANNIGSIILDNRFEADKVSEICKKMGKKMDVMLRLNIGIDAHTHEYIKTAKHTSKFGESIFAEDIICIVKNIVEKKELNFLGFHCHIGSQIFDELAFYEGIETMVKFTKEVSEKLNIIIPEINIGGGFGVRYTKEDTDVNLKKLMTDIIRHLEKTLEVENLKIENVSIEPGRSIVAQAGSTLYTVGGTKETFGGEKYVFIDGGMTDNIRPALYKAEYESVVANKLNENIKEKVTLAGKCCESGDIIIKDTELQKCNENDLVLVSCTGAYGHSMSSNYNKALKPAVVFVKLGKSYLVSKRESYDDLIKNDLLLENIF
ncbi:diaminopimelate decarboxylase [Candidatus Cetobacterium colombiensis]|jgi:diaminopimelate decarboxylase|uniref:Diaminopimelate decarboxylase n=1 Tax=Candidatus Cetobacterium colombiensis TaxID=3073100 RepID=A0ABU4WBM5_9FUSO|nr:diaminopimelate decarboxylase [Candidatus Cetobacterium colombiensis]MDX8336945.1 diaminopimelate decarboxylase [Candidatus Cetobacterium colombiensis]